MGYSYEEYDGKDYHIHSCYSDGELTPEEIVDRRISEGYKAIAITDHDGIEGSRVGYEYVKNNGLEIGFVPGIEFDSSDELSKEIHILGYGFDYDNIELNKALSEMKLWRAKRNDEMVRIINSYGIELTIDELIAVNGGRFIGKPTIARVLVDKGYYRNITEVFDKLLDAAPEIRALRKQTLSTERVIEIIHNAGGIAIMAHPMEQLRKGEDIEDFMPRLVQLLDRLVGYGIDGFECYHPSATNAETIWLRACAEANGLVITGGSDFHSDKNIRIYK